MSGRSSVYVGSVKHARLAPRRRSFDYPVYMLLLDLTEIEQPRRAARAFGGTRFFSTRRFAPARFCREDFLGDPTRPLSECVRDLVEAEHGVRPAGRIQLLANPRSFGYQFNPIAVYYVFDEADESLEYVVADVSNIPWRESHPYVFAAGQDGSVDARTEKLMHVSPFLEMDYIYRLRTAAPSERLNVSVTNSRDGAVEFAAMLDLRLRGASASALRRTLLRFPAMAALVTARIFWQAARMRVAGFRWYPRAQTRIAVESESKSNSPRAEERVEIG